MASGVPECVTLQLPCVSSACFAVAMGNAAILVIPGALDGAVVGTESDADLDCGSAMGSVRDTGTTTGSGSAVVSGTRVTTNPARMHVTSTTIMQISCKRRPMYA